MEAMQFVRAMASLCAVLAMLAGALWVVRRYNLRLPGRIGGAQRGRIGVVERIGIDAKRSLLLIRQDGREHLLLLSPEGHVVVDHSAATPEIAAPEISAPVQEPAHFSFFLWPKLTKARAMHPAANDGERVRRRAHA